MIFYFTGTGNSLFAAKRVLNKDEKLISIANAIQNNEYEYCAQKGETIGFVFPVYFYTVPTIIKEFISKLTIKNVDYIYAIITCGGGIGQSGSVLKKCLEKRNLHLNYVTSLLMPDNSMLFYQIPPVSESKERLENAKKRLIDIKYDIKTQVNMEIKAGTFISDLSGLGYNLCDKTKKFFADENCIGCGLCERVCPQRVIVLKNGKPQWTKESCSKCSACINRCPKSAIQYGKMTKNRNRYVNPEM